MNTFNVLSFDSDTEPHTPEPVVTKKTVPSAPKALPAQRKAWADYSSDEEDDDDIDFPAFEPNKPLNDAIAENDIKQKAAEELTAAIVKKEEEAKDAQIIKSLKKTKTVSVTRTIRSFNKEKNSLETSDKTRTFTVMTSEMFNNTKRLISRYNTHPKSGYDFHAQRDKIKLANSLMQWCYLDPSSRCFIYCSARLFLQDGNELVRDYIKPGSSCPFEMVEFDHIPQL